MKKIVHHKKLYAIKLFRYAFCTSIYNCGILGQWNSKVMLLGI